MPYFTIKLQEARLHETTLATFCRLANHPSILQQPLSFSFMIFLHLLITMYFNISFSNQILKILEIVVNKYLSIVIILAFPHPRIKHFFIVAVRVGVVINPVMYSLSFCKPFLIVLVKLALLYIFIQLYIVCFPQNS